MDIKNLPELHPAEFEHTHKLAKLLQQEIESNGPISLEHYMTQALYHPEYGYYTSARLKLASDKNNSQAISGDFVTAPELSPWFGRTLALAIAEVLAHCAEKNILEFGAGSGILAKQVLDSLEDSNIPTPYSAGLSRTRF